MHMLDPTFPHAVLLMEIMPTLLARREFPPPDTMQTLEPGFRDSPDPGARPGHRIPARAPPGPCCLWVQRLQRGPCSTQCTCEPKLLAVFIRV